MLNESYIPNFYKQNDELNLYENNIRFAIGIENTAEETKDSPYFVKFLARIWDDDEQKVYQFHKCTEEDLNEFYPMEEGTKEKYYDRLFVEKEEFFHCLDWDDDFIVKAERSKTLEIIFAPCNYVLEEYGYREDKETEECWLDGSDTYWNQWYYL